MGFPYRDLRPLRVVTARAEALAEPELALTSAAVHPAAHVRSVPRHAAVQVADAAVGHAR